MFGRECCIARFSEGAASGSGMQAVSSRGDGTQVLPCILSNAPVEDATHVSLMCHFRSDAPRTGGAGASPKSGRGTELRTDGGREGGATDDSPLQRRMETRAQASERMQVRRVVEWCGLVRVAAQAKGGKDLQQMSGGRQARQPTGSEVTVVDPAATHSLQCPVSSSQPPPFPPLCAVCLVGRPWLRCLSVPVGPLRPFP